MSFRPIDFTATLISSSSDTPLKAACLSRKYRPASSSDFKGIRPTSSDPVTLTPWHQLCDIPHRMQHEQGVTEIFVRFIDIWAIPYSSIYQPIAFTDFNEPGIMTFSPFPSFKIFPVTVSPSFLASFSLTSKAIALARQVEVVLRFTLNATRKSLAPTAVAPDLSLKTEGPKSGFQSGSASFFLSPSYSLTGSLPGFSLRFRSCILITINRYA